MDCRISRSFDTLKNALLTALVLGYLDFPKEFILETDTPLKGLGANLLQQGDNGKDFCHCLFCQDIMAEQKIYEKLQLLQIRAIGIGVGHNWKVLW